MGIDDGGKTKDVSAKDWPMIRATTEDLLQDEKSAVEKAREFWRISVDLYSESTKWRERKTTDSIEIFSTFCDPLNLTIFKVKCVMEQRWERVLDVLLDYPSTPRWNDTCETCELVMELPSDPSCVGDTLDQSKECFNWIAYMRTSDSMSKMISKRDFCTCFLMEKDWNGAFYVGTACEVLSVCPHLKKCVRGEQTIIAVKIEKTGENSCVLTQLTSINFKGFLLQSLVDLSMVKGLYTYAQCLSQKVNSPITDEEKEFSANNKDKIPGRKR